MDWQMILVLIVVATAAFSTVRRMVQFFRTPASRCDGCHGCALKNSGKPPFSYL